MKKQRLVVELLDVIQLSSPNIREFDLNQTANEIRLHRLKGKSNPPSYDMAIRQISQISTGLVKRDDLLAHLDTHSNEHWRVFLKDVGSRLFDIFETGVAKWYPVGRKPIETLSGVWTKPAIRGVKICKDGYAFPCLINPRASLHFKAYDLQFLARGVHEFHVIDNPRAAGPMIVDLGKDSTAFRANRVYMPDSLNLMSLEEFEEILRNFVRAAELAGMTIVPLDKYRGLDLFRTRRY